MSQSRTCKILFARGIFLVAPLLVSGIAGAASPDAPLNAATKVELTHAGQWAHPLLPGLATTADGRVTFSDLNAPELIQAAGVPVLNNSQPVGMSIVGGGGSHPASSYFVGAHTPAETAEGDRIFCENPAQHNPYACPNKTIVDVTGKSITTTSAMDCYDATILDQGQYTDSSGVLHTHFWGTPVTVSVANPKTTTAYLNGFAVLSAPVSGLDAENFGQINEPTITTDGRLYVISLSVPADQEITWTNNKTGAPVSGNYNIVYSYNMSGTPCDVTQWKNFAPVSHAHFDPQLQPPSGSSDYVYKFAQFQLRDTEGNLIPDGAELGAVYPWMDRTGTNLFFGQVNANLFYENTSGTISSWFPTSCLPNVSCILPNEMANASEAKPLTPPWQAASDPAITNFYGNFDEIRNTRGLSVAGLWTHGKAVLLDALVNNSDYGFHGPDNFHYNVELYGTSPTTIAIGTSRDGGGAPSYWSNTADSPTPPYYEGNTTPPNSLQNIFNYENNTMRPNTVRDVAWIMNMGKGSSTISFDDFVDPSVLIAADMNASVTWSAAPRPTSLSSMHYNNGVNGAPLHLQNAATTTAFQVPPYGITSTGTLRIEPVALGGRNGKGLWLDGQSGFEYSLPAQSPAEINGVSWYDAHPWYISIAFDNRIQDTTERRLLTFPNGATITVAGSELRYYFAGATTAAHTVSLASAGLLPTKQWTHLAFSVDNTLEVFSDYKIETYINGFHYDIWDVPVHTTGALSLNGTGPIIVGAVSATLDQGIRGWVDDFKVVGRVPDYETICNYAGGTLVGMSSKAGAAGSVLAQWQAVAGKYNATFHAQITTAIQNGNKSLATYPLYACYTDSKSDNGTDLNSIVANGASETPAYLGLNSVRNSLHFPEGPLVYNQPRPDSSKNQFCLSCHQTSQVRSNLLPEALVLATTRYGVNYTVSTDPRRQPFQSPPVLYGHIPAGLFGPGLPAASSVAPSGGFFVDQYVFPSP